MKPNSPRFFRFLNTTFLVAGIFFSSLLSAQVVDLDVGNERYIIPENTKEEFNNITLSKNSAILEVNGTLIVQGDLTMDGNSSQFIMGDNALVVIYGNFQAHNTVEIAVSSFLIVYGDFTQKTGSGKAEIDATNGNIYIFGNVDDGWDNFDTCPDYEGNVSELGTEECDYGTGDNYEDNYEEFPEEFKDAVNCYDLSGISNQIVCENASATFSVASSLNIDQDQVSFQWQKKISDTATWEEITGETNVDYTITEVIAEMETYSYRVLVKPKEPANSNCKISISRKVSLLIAYENTWTGADDTNWNNTNNWSCNTLPTLETNVLIPGNLVSNNYPVINTGDNALAKDLTIENTASATVNDNWLRIAGDLTNSGILNAETGSVSFEGTAAQTIPAVAFENNRIQNLSINNPSGVISEAIIEVTGMLKVDTGNFDTGNQLTLISDATQTALIDGSGGGQVLGNVTMQRYLDNAFGYKYFAAPFSNSKVGDFTDIDLDETFPNFYRYDESRKVNINDTLRDATGWEVYIGPATPLNVMEGYALNFGATTNALTVSLTGEVNNGVYSAELKNNNGEYTKGFHLVGNPYSSPIDWDAATGWTKTNIDDQIHFFTAGTENRYTGTYESYVNGVAQNEGSATSIIPSMQAFFIKVSDSDTDNYPVNGILGISNAVRVNNFTHQFYRNREPAPKSLIRLNAAFEGEGSKDGMVIYFENQASQDFESELDAHKLINTDANVPNLYSLSPDRQQLSINAVARPEEKDATIPLGITTERGGTMSISLRDLENLPYDFAVFLKDEEKNKTVDLRKQAYSFEVKKGKTNSRFELLFSNESNLINEDFGDEFFSVFSSDGQMQVDLNLDEKEEGFLSLSTVTGQLLETKAGRGKEQVNFEGIGSSGVYFVILEKDGKRYTKKVLIRK